MLSRGAASSPTPRRAWAQRMRPPRPVKPRNRGRRLRGLGRLPLRAALLLLAAVLASGGPGTSLAGELEIYRPRHRPAAELAPLVSGVLAPAGAAIADPGSGRLIIRGDRASIKAALAILHELDRPLTAYRVESTLTTLRELRRTGLEIEGWVQAGEVRIGRGTAPAGTARLTVHSVLSEGDTRFQGVVTTLDGHPAEIWTGTVHPERVRTLHERLGRIEVYETTTLVPVRTGFRVLPRGLGDGRVQLEIAPVSAEEAPEGTVVRAGAATQVIVSPGEVLAIASLAGGERALSIDPFGILDLREGATHAVLLVTVETIRGPTPDSPGFGR